MPGLLCDQTVWADQVTALATQARCFIPDLRDHYSLAAMASTALATVDGPISVAGHSMGGRVAFEMWRQAPSRITRLAIMDSGINSLQPGELAKRETVVQISNEQGMQALVDTWLPPMMGPDALSNPAIMDPLVAMIHRSTPQSHAAQIHALLTRPDVTQFLATVNIPTLVAVGRHDAWSPVKQHEYINSLLPNSTLTVIEDAGHMCTIEQPDAVSAMLRQWLQTT